MLAHDKTRDCRSAVNEVRFVNWNLDLFPCLLLVTDLDTNRILESNAYSETLLEIPKDSLIDSNLKDILTKASLIFLESYIRPTVIDAQSCIEVQITLKDSHQQRIPVIANIQLKGRYLYWSLFSAEKRDLLYEELLATQKELEQSTEELIELTRVDPLTNLLNRRAAQSDIQKLLTQVRRKFIPMAFLVVDIDHFKKLNDQYGHDKGDEVLTRNSSILQSSSRQSDVVARWGGEEFLVVLFNSDREQTYAYCDRLHQRIKASTNEGPLYTVSIGVAQLTEDQIDQPNVLDTLIKQADQALYQAKANGRNRTTFFEQASQA